MVISDELNHASIIDGCRLSRAAIKVFPHKDAGAARKILCDLPTTQRKLLITDGVFSMDGDLGSLPELCVLAEEFGCIMMVDDAHASGVFGRNGRGTVDHFAMHGRVDIQVGTLSKAIGVLGGYVAGTRALIDFLYHRARPFLFSTSHPPAVAAACIAALDVLEQEPEIIERLWDNTNFFKTGLKALGFNTGLSESPITPVIAGDGALAMKLSDRLFEEGVFAQGIAFPTVARDRARVRTIVTATHTKDELQFALDVFAKVGRELGDCPLRRSNQLTDFFDTYTKDLKAEDLQRLFTHDTRDAFRFFTRGADSDALQHLPWHQRIVAEVRILFLAFTMKLSPARRVVFGAALLFAQVRRCDLYRGFRLIDIARFTYGISVGLPGPLFRPGITWSLLFAFVLMNLLVLLFEVADRLSLKNDLEIARDIQQAMLPNGL